MTTFIPDANLLTTLAACLGQAEDSLPSHWAVLAPRANLAAYNAVVAALAERGFTAAEIAAWDRAAEFNEQIALCRIFRMASLRGDTFDQAAVTEFCKYADALATTGLTVGGDPVFPTGTAAGVRYGEFDTGADRHTIDDVL